MLDVPTTEGSLLQGTILYNERLLHSVPVLIATIVSAQYNSLPVSQRVNIEVVAHALPSPVPYALGHAVATAFFSLMVAYMPSFYVSAVVTERQQLLKGLLEVPPPPSHWAAFRSVRCHDFLCSVQLVGLRRQVYWATGFVFDYLFSLVVGAVVLILFVSFGTEAVRGHRYFFLAIDLVVGYIPLILWSYWFSSFFPTLPSARANAQALVFVFGILPYIAVTGLTMRGLNGIAIGASHIFSLSPPFAMIAAIGNLHYVGHSADQTETFAVGSIRSIPAGDVLAPGTFLLYLAFDIVIFGACVAASESRGLRRMLAHLCWRRGFGQPSEEESRLLAEEDADVAAERMRIAEHHEGTADVLQITSLRKVFAGGRMVTERPKVAVGNLSVGIQPGECLGLLGPNGAGKTTTFRMLTGDLEPESGAIRLLDSLRSPGAIGYSPQECSLWPDMTGREHLELFASIKGVAADARLTAVQNMIDATGLRGCADDPVRVYSLGVRRKLSVALALFARPGLVILDEPTTSVDPVTRRALWDLILSAKKHQNMSFLLSTHLIDEAEALCDRVGILVNGRLQCLGTPQMLRSKFGGSYRLIVKPLAASAHEQIMAALPHASLLPVSTDFLFVYQIPTATFQLSVAFKSLESVVTTFPPFQILPVVHSCARLSHIPILSLWYGPHSTGACAHRCRFLLRTFGMVTSRTLSAALCMPLRAGLRVRIVSDDPARCVLSVLQKSGGRKRPRLNLCGEACLCFDFGRCFEQPLPEHLCDGPRHRWHALNRSFKRYHRVPPTPKTKRRPDGSQ
jgi:ABC-type multidrug transport system ATPase subunit